MYDLLAIKDHHYLRYFIGIVFKLHFWQHWVYLNTKQTVHFRVTTFANLFFITKGNSSSFFEAPLQFPTPQSDLVASHSKFKEWTLSVRHVACSCTRMCKSIWCNVPISFPFTGIITLSESLAFSPCRKCICIQNMHSLCTHTKNGNYRQAFQFNF